MAQTIKLRRSASQGAIPTVSQLSLGEIAINTHDGILYIKKDDGTESIVTLGSGSSDTAAELLTKIKTVDGTGTGLDADLLDGQQGSYYAAADSYLPLAGGTLTGALTGTSGSFSATVAAGTVASMYTSSDRGYFVAGTNDASNQHLYFGSYHGATLKELTFSGSNNAFYPQTSASIDLGLTSKKFKNLELSGTVRAGSGKFGGTSNYTSDGTVHAVGSIGIGASDNLNPSLNRWSLRARAGGIEGAFDIYDARHSQTRLTINSAGNVGIGTSAPTAKVTVSGTGVGAAIDWTNTTASIGRSYRWVSLNSGGFAVEDLTASGAERMRINSAGGLSVGTTAATGAGGILADNDIKTNSRFGVGSGGTLSTAAIYKNSDANTGIYWPANNQIALTTAGAERLRIDSAGNVGIGTTSPQENLEIHDATMSTISLSYAGGSGSGSSIDFNLRPAGAIASPLTSQIKALDDGAFRQNISFSTKTSAAASSGQTTRMMIKADGNVGIGTSSPSSALHAKGGSIATPADSSAFLANATARLVVNHGNEYGAYVGYLNSTNDAIGIQSARSSAQTGPLSLNPYGGNVGIGTNSPNNKLDVYGSGAGEGVFVRNSNNSNYRGYYMGATDGDNTVYAGVELHATSGQLRHYVGPSSYGGYQTFLTAGTERMRIDSAGNVGIGTSSPVQKLHVVGGTDSYVAKFEHSPPATGYAPGSILLEANGAHSRGQGIFHYNTVADDSWFTGVPYNVQSTKWVVAHKADTTFNPDVAQLTHSLLTIDSANGYIDAVSASQVRLSLGSTGTAGTNTANWIRGTGNLLGFNSAGGGFHWEISGTQRMIMDSAGRVGIGTSNPLDLLHINSASGDARQIIDAHTGFDAELKYAVNGTVKYTTGYDAATDSFVIGTSNVDTGKRVVINNAGKVLVNGAHDNGGKADFAVDGGMQIALYDGQVQTGGTDMNWNSKFFYDGHTKLGGWDNDVHLFSRAGSTGTAKSIIFSPQAAGGASTETMRVIGGLGATIGDLSVANTKLQINQSGVASGIHIARNDQTSTNFATTRNRIIFGDEIIGSGIRHQASVTAVREAWSSSPTALTFETSATVNAATEKLRITSAGDVGIGTNAPDTNLHVFKASAGSITNYANNALVVENSGDVGISLLTPNASAGHLMFGSPGHQYHSYIRGGYGASTTSTLKFYTDGINTMTHKAGKVGIGTTAPGDKLTIEGAGAQVLSIYSSDTGSQSLAKTFINLYGENTAAEKKLQAQIASAPGHNASSAGELHFSTNNSSSAITRRMTIREDGNVGIGTDAPAYLLQVKKDVDSFVMKIENNGNSAGTSGNSYADASDGLWVDTRWNTATNTPFKVTSNSGTTPMMVIKGNGNVGIGTNAPSEKLEVAGSIKVDSNFTLTADSSTLTTTTSTVIASFSATTYGAAKLIITVKDGSNRHMCELLVTHNGTTAIATQYGSIYTSSELATFEVDISGGNVRLLAVSSSTNSTVYRVAQTLMEA